MINEFRLVKGHLENPFVDLLEMKIVEVGEGKATLTMPVAANKHTNLYNTAHGGSLASLADTVMGVACATTGKKVVTLDMNLNFIRPATPPETLSAFGRVIHNGNHTLVAETDIVDSMGNLILKARATFFVVGTFSAASEAIE
ncbi:MAG TPA: PaaI family thioesterase [Methylomusa anaerophila]|uniref:Acyl-coenzyme A thioesterase PaaI n=1 Tax=Methylomusa anaerophila TaxID=1930071 RepID=A0A348ALL5_9FIRM|nr:PaaI family thioesterase [Methylomusa anaerophila]BBB91963.1 acyl-coenzyme A thioesterase PaaI [Methylomusa anaerophila]HML88025.1 PaaI family thioesterase [Methylomusa anaerophila]